MYIPKFRSTRRLVTFCQLNYVKERLPAENEKCFFSGKENPSNLASNVANYATMVGKLDSTLEALLKVNRKALLSYLGTLKMRNAEIPSELEDELKGDDESLLKYAKDIVRSRLPSRLEDTLSHPSYCVSYSQFIRIALPEHLEDKVFTPNEQHDGDYIATQLPKYANATGVLRDNLKQVLKHNHSAIIEYGKWLRMNGMPMDAELRDELAGDSHRLIELASIIGGRLPEHLEKTLSDPSCCYSYARNVLRGRLPAELEAKLANGPDYCVKYAEEIVRGRLPEEIEIGLMKDHNAAVRYAFGVIRAFAPVRLPEQIHAYLVMKSFELPNDTLIKKYIDACDSDPNKMGNSSARVS
jgi:hypothetical protein